MVRGQNYIRRIYSGRIAWSFQSFQSLFRTPRAVRFGLFLLLSVYLTGAISQGTSNLQYYLSWAEGIDQGHLFELYHIENGQSTSALSQNFIVPYPPLTVYFFWITYRVLFFLDPSKVSHAIFMVNSAALVGTLGIAGALTKFGRKFGNLSGFIYLLTPAVFLLSPLLSYQDSLMALFLLVGIHELCKDRSLSAGIFLAASLMCKQLSLMPIAGLVMVLVLQRKFRLLVKVGVAFIGFILAVLSPFIMSKNIFAYFESQTLASIHTMLSAQAANVPYLISLLYRCGSLGLANGIEAGGSGLRIADRGIRQSVYFGFGLLTILLFCYWLFSVYRRFGFANLDYFHVSIMMIFTYYLFSAGVHENHIFMALPLIFCLPSTRCSKRLLLAFSTGLTVHLLACWGLGASFPNATERLSLSGAMNTFTHILVFCLYSYSYIKLWKMNPSKVISG
jgi:hypothetical protein